MTAKYVHPTLGDILAVGACPSLVLVERLQCKCYQVKSPTSSMIVSLHKAVNDDAKAQLLQQMLKWTLIKQD
jgi:hypothetical protein